MMLFVRTIPAIKSINTFAFTLIKKQIELTDNINNNILISPLSIYLIVSMVYNGAANATKKAIAETLQLHNIATTQLNETCKQLIEQLPSEDDKVTVAIANAIWHNKNVHPLSSFITINKTYFHAGMQQLTTAEVINAWVADKTQGKITGIVNNIPADMLMLLVNAVYFNANWQHKFYPYGTYTNKFYLENGDVVETKFMDQDIVTNNYIDTNYRIVELPYGNGNSYCMYVIDSNNKANINKLITALNSDAIKALVARMRSTKIELHLPKWESSYSINDMKPLLTAMGMGITFTNDADFGNMYTEPALISSAVHKTYIKVAEEGTTAAAVTAMGVAAGAAPMASPPKVIFNRPFMYIIAAKQTGAMLFTGVLNNPLLND